MDYLPQNPAIYKINLHISDFFCIFAPHFVCKVKLLNNELWQRWNNGCICFILSTLQIVNNLLTKKFRDIGNIKY